MQRIFNLQYQLTLRKEVQIRTYTDSDEDEHEYEYFILHVNFESCQIGDFAADLLTAEQLAMYRIYIETSGNKPLIFGGGSPDMSASEDLSGVQGVQFVSGTRSGNTVIADLAKQQGVLWFTSHGQWGSRSYENIAPGDAIFFDWDLDGSADHVGLVIGTDGSRVYKVLIVTRSEKDKCLNLRISNILLYTSGTVIGYTINCKDKIHPCICKGNFHG